MSTWLWVLIAIVVVLIAAVAATVAMRQRRTAMLRQRFGPEYDRTVGGSQNTRAAEAALLARERQRSRLDIKPLPEASRIRFAEEWRGVQERFVDQPAEAAAAADQLVSRVMAERGYPMGDFSAQADLISVDHPDVVEDYRVAHVIQERAAAHQASTEEMREGLLRYRALFEVLLRPERTADTAERPAGTSPEAAPAAPDGTAPATIDGPATGDATATADGTAATDGTGVRDGAATGGRPATGETAATADGTAPAPDESVPAGRTAARRRTGVEANDDAG
jgi:hypothetical protein